jgi:hypothetical protein
MCPLAYRLGLKPLEPDGTAEFGRVIFERCSGLLVAHSGAWLLFRLFLEG